MVLPQPLGAPPDRTALHNAALAYLARFAATEAGLLRVLERRITRWARAAALEGQDTDQIACACDSARQAARQVTARLVEAGVLNDLQFAEARAHSLSRAGRSRQAITAHLATRGVSGDAARQAAPSDPDTELAAALIQARRKRIGPFGQGDITRADLGKLARAGFSGDVARRALHMSLAEAEERLHAAREG